MKERLADISNFLEAGGVLLRSDWDGMDVATKAAFVAVARRRRVEDAIRLGRASSGPMGVLEVVSEIDGGLALEEALLRTAVINAAG